MKMSRISAVLVIVVWLILWETSTSFVLSHHDLWVVRELTAVTRAVEEPESKTLLVFGLGNIGLLVAMRAHDEGLFDKVYGTSRTSTSNENVQGVQTIDYSDSDCLREILPTCSHVLVTIPPSKSSMPGACDTVLSNPSLGDFPLPSSSWVGFVSSSSVYGNHNGHWVHEDSAIKCSAGSKGELYFRAENEWREASAVRGWRLNVFRSAGLYGDNRSIIHTIMQRGFVSSSSGSKDGDFPTSRIHECDVARAILSSMLQGTEGDWNLADDFPAPRAEVMAFGASLLAHAGLCPKEAAKDSSDQKSERFRRRKTDRKRVLNIKMKESLLPDQVLLYPTYKDGLQSVIDANILKWRLVD
ncbi:hypothetical protein THAOC_05311 [Thalassiosira oceanica]|uniref:NAD-dependent epimerase/dehydratase domain-containing protein n=1 Tax=Thalassiosira oceanica TaxID=159749 RepID=K0T5X9_THAOC|nr:hypothetical protein THAOC_05311 [Thalassiosira oceanica]|eukprot:EJK73085.1 hypothetical protein THAOC_05311 [Thalassiosira oceanica]